MRERITQLVRQSLNEGFVTVNQLKRLEQELDRLFAEVGIDVNFTRHFMDRVNDVRNEKEITIEELRYIFKRVYAKYKDQLLNFSGGFEGVFKNPPTEINIPFALNWDNKNKELDLDAKTIMRKKNFRTSNQVLSVEGDSNNH